MTFASDLRILYHLALKPVRGKDHAARMESFYAGQAAGYDDFRRRLLKGRQELWNLIQPPAGGTWLDMGGGTGANLEFFTPTRSVSEGGPRLRFGLVSMPQRAGLSCILWNSS